ncbi:MAG: hypothetical protein M0R22_05585 [Dehalococcoidia bacterium]|jgi:N-acetylneuraminic acid mutarotase|nr:hypothetical protein [Dehalococcoidia bacterium]
MKRAIATLATAAIARLGENSPAADLASNTFLLKDITDFLGPGLEYIMVCGGGGPDRSTLLFSVTANAWRRGPCIQADLSNSGIARTDDGRIYVVGGTNHYDDLSADMYAIAMPDGHEWTRMQPMAVRRSHPGVGVVGGMVYVFGGFGNSTDICLSTCEVFDTRRSMWEAIASMPTPRYSMGVAVIGSRIYVIGGAGYAGTHRTVEVLDTKTGMWTTYPPMPTARWGVAVAVVDDRFIWAFGGFDIIHLDVIEVLDTDKGEWATPSITMPTPRIPAGAVAIDHKIYIVGGAGYTGAQRAVEVLDLDSMKWSAASQMPDLRPHGSVIGL